MASTRRLAAIVAADVVGYSRLMGLDEAGTVQALREHRATADPIIAEHGGRVVKTTGDGLLIEFVSVVGAVECALALQHLAAERNAEVPSDRRTEWRVGVHLGDVLIEGDDILGDGVNIAARLEGIAEPNGICVSEDAFRQVRGKVEAEFSDLGEQSLKNIARPLRVYRVGSSPAAPALRSAPATLPLPDKPSIAVLPFANMSGDPEQEYFADGMVEEIITALSRIRWLFVIARNSSFTYKGQAVDVKAVGRELGVAYEMVWSSARQIPEALRLTEQALLEGRSEDREADRLKSAEFARRALEVAGDDPGVLANAAEALAYLGEDIGAMMALADRALALNPNFARGWHISGALRVWAGQLDLAIEHLETALRLSPRARVGGSLFLIGAADFLSRRFNDAVPKLLLAIQDDPSRPHPYRYLAGCYAHMGRLDEAREVVTRLRAITSVVIPTSSLRNAEHRELLLSGLRLAAGEGT